jgi:hypothetical protein
MSGRDSGGCKGSVRPRAAWEDGRVRGSRVLGRGPRGVDGLPGREAATCSVEERRALRWRGLSGRGRGGRGESLGVAWREGGEEVRGRPSAPLAFRLVVHEGLGWPSKAMGRQGRRDRTGKAARRDSRYDQRPCGVPWCALVCLCCAALRGPFSKRTRPERAWAEFRARGVCSNGCKNRRRRLVRLITHAALDPARALDRSRRRARHNRRCVKHRASRRRAWRHPTQRRSDAATMLSARCCALRARHGCRVAGLCCSNLLAGGAPGHCHP